MARDRYWLDRIMAFGHVIRVNLDGSVEETVPGAHAPELVIGTADDDCGSILAGHEEAYTEDARRQGWEILAGWSGQSSYRGLCMHSSEFIGGDLAAHILATPGLWVAITVEDGTEDGADGSWALAYREEEHS